MNTLTRKRELDKIYKFLAKYETKNIMVIYDLPVQMTAMNYGSINHRYAKQKWKYVYKNFKDGLFEHLFIIEKHALNKKRRSWYDNKLLLKPIYKFQKDGRNNVVISEAVTP